MYFIWFNQYFQNLRIMILNLKCFLSLLTTFDYQAIRYLFIEFNHSSTLKFVVIMYSNFVQMSYPILTNLNSLNELAYQFLAEIVYNELCGYLL